MMAILIYVPPTILVCQTNLILKSIDEACIKEHLKYSVQSSFRYIMKHVFKHTASDKDYKT